MINFIKEIYTKYEEMINYLIIGVMTTVISLIVKYALLFTVLDAKNAIQLQISIIVSWIVAVIFAYVTNRIFVFKSKNSNILKEICLFFSSRVVTLLMESAILWFFITYLKLNSNLYVILWTLVTQVVVIVGNYILSKFLVFSKNKPKLFSDKEKISFFILFLLVLVICYFFPYTHDDWDWGSSTGIERLEAGFANFNGRWVGNSLGMFLTRFRIVRALTISLTFVSMLLLIKKIVNSENKSIIYASITLLLLMPVRMFAQSFAWTVSFANYVIPAVIILWIIYKNKNLFEGREIEISNRWILIFLFLGFIATLFVEHLTIYHVVLGIFLVGYSLIKFKKISLPNLFYLLGSIAGSILMFSNSGYRTLFGEGDGYRSIENDNFILRAIKTYFGDFKNLLVNNNFILNMAICVLGIILSYQFLKKAKKESARYKKIILKLSIAILSIFMTYQMYMKMALNANLFIRKDIRNLVEGGFIFLYGIAIIAIIIIAVSDSKRRNRMLFEIGSIVMISLPLLVVKPIGPRCFFPTYLLFVLLTMEFFTIVTEKVKIDFSGIVKVSAYTLTCFLLVLYGYVFMIEQKRIDYMEHHKEDEKLVLPKIPYENFMQHPNPENEWFRTQYRQFYGLNNDVELEFISYKEWKKEYEK